MNSPYISPVSSSSLNMDAASPVVSSPRSPSSSSSNNNIRERTRQVIEKNRRNRDLRRTYAGTSPSASLSPKSSHSQQHPQHEPTMMMSDSGAEAVPIVEPIYQDIELHLHEHELYEGRLDVHVPQQQQRQTPSSDAAAAAVAGPAGRRRRRRVDMQEQASPHGDLVKFANSSFESLTESRERATVVLTSKLPPSNPFVYSGPFNTEAARRMGYKTTSEEYASLSSQQRRDQQPLYFRQEESGQENGSVMTGMSQQELIRKKARETSAKRREHKKKTFGKKRKPIVQLPASLLHSTTQRIAAPRAANYVQTEGKKKTGKSTTRSPWNNFVKNLSLSRSTSDDIESSTAETTNETPPAAGSFAAAVTAPPAGSFAAAVIPLVPKRSRGTEIVDLDEDIDDDDDDDEASFPILSASKPGSMVEEDVAAAAASAWMTSSPPLVPPPAPTTSKNPAAFDSRSCNDASSSESTSSSSKGVRFAETVVGDDDENNVPWDQRTDMAKHRSPTSTVDDARVRNEKPKSILRSPKFGSKSGTTRYYGSERRALDFESVRLEDRTASEDQDLALAPVDFDKEGRAMVDYSWAKKAATQTSIGQHLNREEEPDARLSTSRESQQSSEVPPPATSRGFVADSGSEISSIRSYHSTAAAGRRSPPLLASHIVGHPAEKHLQDSIATARNMRGGDIAARVIEEDYPDPPCIIDMDDDETVMSAFVFIETVAAIVIQTALRRFLAVLYAEELRHARALPDAKHSKEKDRSFDDSATQEDDREVDISAEYALDMMFELAAVQIQSVFRGFWLRDCLDVDHYCANVIQTAYRRHCCRENYRRDLQRVIMVQSWWRRNIARDQAATILAYVTIVQALFRGYRYRVRRCSMEIAATTIQSTWRAFAGQSDFIRTLVDVLIVQCIVRKWLARRRAATLREQLKAAKPPLASSSRKQDGTRTKSRQVKGSESLMSADVQHRRPNDRAFERGAGSGLRNIPLVKFQDDLHENPTDETDNQQENLRRTPDPPGLVERQRKSSKSENPSAVTGTRRKTSKSTNASASASSDFVVDRPTTRKASKPENPSASKSSDPLVEGPTKRKASYSVNSSTSSGFVERPTTARKAHFVSDLLVGNSADDSAGVTPVNNGKPIFEPADRMDQKRAVVAYPEWSLRKKKQSGSSNPDADKVDSPGRRDHRGKSSAGKLWLDEERNHGQTASETSATVTATAESSPETDEWPKKGGVSGSARVLSIWKEREKQNAARGARP